MFQKGKAAVWNAKEFRPRGTRGGEIILTKLWLLPIIQTICFQGFSIKPSKIVVSLNSYYLPVFYTVLNGAWKSYFVE